MQEMTMSLLLAFSTDLLGKEIESRTIDRAAPFSYQTPLARSYCFGTGIQGSNRGPS
jgi:hypothetical protein